jgi:HSP20 family protein
VPHITLQMSSLLSQTTFGGTMKLRPSTDHKFLADDKEFIIMAQDLRRSQTQSDQSGAQSGTLARRRHTFEPFFPNADDMFRMSPFQLMRHFSDEMDRMWHGVYPAGAERRGEELATWRPVVDINERDGQLQVRADLPGVNEKDVRISTENETLIIQGERKREEEREEGGWYRAERSYGSFYRAIPLPQGAEVDKANANFRNGVLEITIPVPKSQPNVRQIPISTSAQSSPTTTQANQEKVSRAGGS